MLFEHVQGPFRVFDLQPALQAEYLIRLGRLYRVSPPESGLERVLY